MNYKLTSLSLFLILKYALCSSHTFHWIMRPENMRKGSFGKFAIARDSGILQSTSGLPPPISSQSPSVNLYQPPPLSNVLSLPISGLP